MVKFLFAGSFAAVPCPAATVANPVAAEVDAADPVWGVTHRLTCDACDGRSIWEATTPKAERLERFVGDLLYAGWTEDEVYTWFVERRPEWALDRPWWQRWFAP